MNTFYIFRDDDLEQLKELKINNKNATFEYFPNPKIPLIFRKNPPILCLGSFFGARKCIEFLLNNLGYDINMYDCDGLLPIHYAIAGNKLKEVEHLIKFGSKMDGIIYYSILFENIKILQYALNNNIDNINNKFNDVFPLDLAKKINNSLIISLLIASGANNDIVKVPNVVKKEKEIIGVILFNI